MNIQTFSDAVKSKRASLAHDLDVDDDDDEGDERPQQKDGVVDGEEEEGSDRFNDGGVAMEPFNLKNEREGGYFDENDNYVFKKEHGEVDAWVAGLDEAAEEAAIGEAAMAERRRLAKLAEVEAEDEVRLKKTPLELKSELLGAMQPGEKLAATLRRLSGKSEIQHKAIRRRRADDQATDGPTEKPLSAAEQRKQQGAIAKANRAAIERVTEIADLLLSSGVSGIYDLTYEAIYASTVMWEYKGADGKLYGPYSSQEISLWKAQGYLSGPTAVMMRQVQSSLPKLLSAQKVSQVDSIYDDEDLDEAPAAKRSKTDSTAVAGADTDSDWVSSDDVDFGVFLNLDKEAQRYDLRQEAGSRDREGKKVGLDSVKPFSARAAAKDHHKSVSSGVEVEDVSDDDN